MVTQLVVCWIVTHTKMSGDKLDYRDNKQFHGYVMHDTDDTITVNFFDAFKKAGLNLDFNATVQTLNDHDCSYE
jgi:hypothetical protein